MSHLASYPKVYGYGHKYLTDLLKSGVTVVQEKVDGSQFSFRKVESGEVQFRSRTAIIQPEQPPNMFAPAVKYVLSVATLLVTDATYRGEAFHKPKHNVMAYARVPHGNVALFDVEYEGQNFIYHPQTLNEYAEHLGLEPVTNYFYGDASQLSLEKLMEFLKYRSFLGGGEVEGIVVKNYDRFGIDGKVMMAKIVSADFKEKHRTEWKGMGQGKGDIVTRIVEVLKTEARWRKAVQHLREAGTLLEEPKDIGSIILELKRDLLEEEGEWLKEQMFKELIGDVLRGVCRGVAEWYKAELMKATEGVDDGMDTRSAKNAALGEGSGG